MSDGPSSPFLSAREIEQRYGLDLITAEAIRAGLIAVTGHMFQTLQRSGFSNIVRELQDFGVAIHLVEPTGTEMVAITEGCTHFAFTLPHMTNLVVDEWGIDNLGPGDTIVCNDPWRGSIHLPDVNLFRPVFWEGEPLFVLSDAAHLIDLGGPLPGSFNNTAREVFAEGVRIPPTLITSGDVPVRSTINLLLENSRTPQINLGDLRALFGTMRVGEGRLIRLLEQYGREAVGAACRYTLDLAERRMADAIGRVPDGAYAAEEWCDDDGRGDEPVFLRLGAKVQGRHMEIDFSGSDRQPLGALTTCWEETNRVLLGPKMLLDPRHPMNSGAMRPFHVLAAPGSVVMGEAPTSCSQHAELGAHVAALSIKLMSEIVPARAAAADSGTSHVHNVTGLDSRPGRVGHPFGAGIMGGNGWGGTSSGDGISFCAPPIYGISSPIYELLERDAPVILRSANLLIDSAGAGRHRAGYATCLMIECISGELAVTSVLDSARFTRSGAAGGGDGMTSYVFAIAPDPDHLIPQRNGVVPLDRLTALVGRFDASGAPDPRAGSWGLGAVHRSAKLTNHVLQAGEALLVLPAGGAGFGDPLQRPADEVRLDVWNEKLSIAAAAELYGVIVAPDSLQILASETQELRAQLRERWADGPGPPVACVHPWPRSVDDGAWRQLGQASQVRPEVSSR